MKQEELGALTALPPEPVRFLGRGMSVVAFHGFGGTTREVELCTDVAREAGFSAFAQALPGHGSHARDLAKTRFADWVRGADGAYDELPKSEPVIAVGLSMGSLMATHLAVSHPERVKGLVLLANAFWLNGPLGLVLRAGGLFRLPDFLLKKKGSDITDPEARATQISYTADPAHAAIDLERSGRAMRERLAQVQCPTLILHGALDRVCPVQNAWRVAQRLGTRDVRVQILPRSRHIITRDVERDDVARELRTFYARVASSAQTPVEP